MRDDQGGTTEADVDTAAAAVVEIGAATGGMRGGAAMTETGGEVGGGGAGRGLGVPAGRGPGAGGTGGCFAVLKRPVC